MYLFLSFSFISCFSNTELAKGNCIADYCVESTSLNSSGNTVKLDGNRPNDTAVSKK